MNSISSINLDPLHINIKKLSNLNQNIIKNIENIDKILEHNYTNLKYNNKLNIKEISEHIIYAYNNIDKFVSEQESNLSNENKTTVDKMKTFMSYLAENKESIDIVLRILKFIIFASLQILSLLYENNAQQQNINYINKTINVINILDNDTENIINNCLNHDFLNYDE